MAVVQQVTGDLRVTGDILCQSDAISPQDRTSILAEETLTRYPVVLSEFEIFDAPHNRLGATPTSDDDLAFVGGTFGSAAPMIQAGDVKAVTKTRRARKSIPIPHNYVAGKQLQIIVGTKMVTTIADTSCTVDLEIYRADKQGGIGSDLCTTSATSMNSLTAAEKAFATDPATLSPGDWLDVRVTIASVDGATATAVTPAITSIDLACNTKG
jgi:hypothetical protein